MIGHDAIHIGLLRLLRLLGLFCALGLKDHGLAIHGVEVKLHGSLEQFVLKRQTQNPFLTGIRVLLPFIHK